MIDSVLGRGIVVVAEESAQHMRVQLCEVGGHEISAEMVAMPFKFQENVDVRNVKEPFIDLM